MGGNMARRIARRRVRELSQFIWKEEGAATIAGLLTRLGQKDFIIAQYENAVARLNDKLTEMSQYAAKVEALLVEFLEGDHSSADSYADWLGRVKETVYGKEEEPNGRPSGDSNEGGESEGQADSSPREERDSGAKGEEGKE